MNTYKLTSLLLIGASFAWACNQKQQQNQRQAPPPTQVSTDVVTEQIVTGMESFPGSVVPLNETELRAEVNGYITHIFVNDGASVSKGQKMYEIDRTRYEAAEQQASANLAIAKSNLERIKRDVERYRKLAAQDAIAKQTLDYAETDLNNAEAQVASAQAALITASTNLKRSTIVAPFDGTIGISQVRNGALVSAGSTLLNTISSVSPIAVDFSINQHQIQRFIALQKQTNIEKDSIIRLSLTDGSPYSYPGKISVIDRSVNRNTGTITVRASFANPEGLLRTGMNTQVLVRSQSEAKQLVIPYQAVIEQLGQSSVFVVTDSSTVEERLVKLGLKTTDKIVVESGLSLGETIVTQGVINLRSGAKVTVQSADQNQK